MRVSGSRGPSQSDSISPRLPRGAAKDLNVSPIRGTCDPPPRLQPPAGQPAPDWDSARHSASEWDAYPAVNERFADEVVRGMKRGDSIWIHDYPLFLLPRLIRTRVPDARIGFFLHIPFPPYDVFRLLPWHREVLEGLLGADLIGFHTYDYARAVLGSVLRDLGLDNRIGMTTAGHR